MFVRYFLVNEDFIKYPICNRKQYLNLFWFNDYKYKEFTSTNIGETSHYSHIIPTQASVIQCFMQHHTCVFSKPYQCCPITKTFFRSRVAFHVNVYISSNISVVNKGGIISVFRWLVTPSKWPRGHKLYRRDYPYMDGPSAITYQCIMQGQLFILHCVFYWCQGPIMHICFKGIG